jgi:hypothetical protein
LTLLEPQTRATLTEQLAPPSGFELSRAVGTTFTLDLATALGVPLSFASRHVSSGDDTIGVLDAVRRVADRIDVFAQAGEISMGNPSDLVAFLEPMIHPVQVRRGLFHPKVWFLEYAAGDRRAYRFLCASRNLTDDRSWDTIIRLDGSAEDATTRDQNDPLVELLTALPALTINPLPQEREAEILAFAERLRAVKWELPSAARAVQFHTVGLPGSTLPNFQGIRALIISPFVTDEGLRMLRADVRTTTHLLSRATTLDALPPTAMDEQLTTYVLDDAATGDDPDEDGPQLDHLSGLHAKAVIIDRRDGAHVFLGSANATDAAWRSNIEVMVEFTGTESKFGVNATLEALGELKEEYPTQGGVDESDDEKDQRRLEAMVRKLAGARLTARVVPGAPHGLRVWGGPEAEASIASLVGSGITLHWHLLTRADLGASVLSPDEASAVTLTDVPLTDITPFIALVARDAKGNTRRTIVLAHLLDDIPTRKDAIVARQLTDRAAFIRLLTLMLELSGDLLGDGSGWSEFTFGATAADRFDGAGLFEALVRALGAGHNGLADVRRIVDYVQEHGDEHDLLPEGFDELWTNVWEAHHSLTRGRA